MSPKHIKIANEIESEIRQNRYHGKLPPLRQLADAYNVSLRTIQKALQPLNEKQLIVSDSTRGNIIIHHPPSGLIGVFCNFRKGRPSDTLIATLRDNIEKDGLEAIFLDVPETVVLNSNSTFWRYGWADGYVFLHGTADTDIWERLREFNLPSVAANRERRSSQVSCVDFDHVDLLTRLFEEFYQKGYRRIALSFTILSEAIFADAVSRYKELTRKRGCAAYVPCPDDIDRTVSRDVRILQQFERFFKAPEPPDAIICFHRGMQLARELVRQHGSEIALAGTGHEETAGPNFLPLEYSYEALGSELWTTLKKQMSSANSDLVIQKLLPMSAVDFSVIKNK